MGYVAGENQYGYDLKLGGWDDYRVCNAFFKDLVVVPNRALSDSEVEEIYKTQMRTCADKFQVRYRIKEGFPGKYLRIKQGNLTRIRTTGNCRPLMLS